MRIIRGILKGAFGVLFLCFAAVNLLVLYFVDTDAAKIIKFELLDYHFVTIDTSIENFGYVFTYEGMLAALILGGILGLLCSLVFPKKTS